MPLRLTDEQTAFFRSNGYLIYDQPVFPAAQFAALKDHFEGKLARWSEDANGATPEHMDVPHFVDLKLFDWLLDDAVLDLVEPLLGPDIALWSSHFICKPPGTGKRVPWHEDSAYWGRVLDPMEVITVWLAIDESTPENGCMRVIPGSHHHGYSDYEPVAKPESEVFGIEIKKDQLDESKAVDLVLQPNQCSLHHAKLIHGSAPNNSDRRRCGYTMRYVPTSSRFGVAEPIKRAMQIYLARGVDRAGNTYGDPMQPNHAWIEATEKQRRQVKQIA